MTLGELMASLTPAQVDELRLHVTMLGSGFVHLRRMADGKVDATVISPLDITLTPRDRRPTGGEINFKDATLVDVLNQVARELGGYLEFTGGKLRARRD